QESAGPQAPCPCRYTRTVTNHWGHSSLSVRSSWGTPPLQADARHRQETAQSVGGWDVSWCGMDLLGERTIQYSPRICYVCGRAKRLRGVTTSLGGGKNIGLVEPEPSLE